MAQISVIIPTYLEAANLGKLVTRISEVASSNRLDIEILVVDDNSPDNTVAVVEALREQWLPVRLIVRCEERGLATAVMRGMEEATGELLVVMDADLSHSPERIPDLLRPLKDPKVDLVIGSRYARGGSTSAQWGIFRRCNSLVATLLARPLTRVADPMAGYFALRRSTYLACREELNPVGYKIALEIIVKARCRNIVEVPIEFEDRRLGKSKMNLAEQVNYLRHLAGLYRFSFSTPAKEGLFQFTWARATVLFAVACVCGLLFTLARKDPGELPIYIKAAQRYLAGERFYRAEEGKGFTYPPFFVLPFVPYALLPDLAARVAWNITNFALCGAYLWLVARRLGSVFGRAAWLPLLGGGIIVLPLLLSPLEYQGHDYVVLLLSLMAVILWDTRKYASGMYAGLAAACKATPLLFLPALVVARQYRTAAFMVLTLVAATLLPDLFVRAPGGELAITTWQRTFLSGVGAGVPAEVEGGAWVPWNLQNQSLAGTCYRITTRSISSWHRFGRDIALLPLDAGQAKRLTLALQLGVVGLLGWVCLRFPRHPYPLRSFDQLGLGGLVMAAMVLLSPMSNTPHFAALFVLVVYLMVKVWGRRDGWLAAIPLCVVVLIGVLTAKDLVGDPVKRLAMAYGVHTWAALCCFVTASVLMLRQFQVVRESSKTNSSVVLPLLGLPVRMIAALPPLEPQTTEEEDDEDSLRAGSVSDGHSLRR